MGGYRFGAIVVGPLIGGVSAKSAFTEGLGGVSG